MAFLLLHNYTDFIKNWQHQIMTALKSKEHLGVLTASPITDMKITLIGGKGSIVHSVGGCEYLFLHLGCVLIKYNY